MAVVATIYNSWMIKSLAVFRFRRHLPIDILDYSDLREGEGIDLPNALHMIRNKNV